MESFWEIQCDQKSKLSIYAIEFMVIRDKFGWPVEKIVGRPLTNVIRVLLHGNIRQTYHKLHKEKYVKAICELYTDGELDSKTMHVIAAKFDGL